MDPSELVGAAASPGDSLNAPGPVLVGSDPSPEAASRWRVSARSAVEGSLPENSIGSYGSRGHGARIPLHQGARCSSGILRLGTNVVEVGL